MLNAYQVYTQMKQDNILFSFKGVITKDLLNALCEVVDEKLKTINEEPRVRKKVYNILVEILQNIYRHVDEIEENTNEGENYKHDAIFLITGGKKYNYTIQTGNFILNSKVEDLESRIKYVNTLTSQQLRDHYVASLDKSEISEKGGAGLGIIDIARKSGEQLEYEFINVNETYSFFSLLVHVPVNESKT